MVFIIPWSIHLFQLVYRNSNISLYRTWFFLRFFSLFHWLIPLEIWNSPICLQNTGYLVESNFYYVVGTVHQLMKRLKRFFLLLYGLSISWFISHRSGCSQAMNVFVRFPYITRLIGFWMYCALEIGPRQLCLDVITCLSYDR